MKTCSVCEREITPTMLRHGAALTRGGEYLHRECHRAFEPSRPSPQPRGTGPSVGEAQPVSFEVEYASFWRRFGANFIDGLILNAVSLLVAIPLGLPAILGNGQPSGGPGVLIANAVLILLPIVYTMTYWTKRGATPGKSALGIRVVNADDAPPTGTQAFLRYLGYILSSIPFCLGYAWMLFDREKRCWHDIISGTRVIRA